MVLKRENIECEALRAQRRIARMLLADRKGTTEVITCYNQGVEQQKSRQVCITVC